MKSGLEGRNNQTEPGLCARNRDVSMKSGLEGRNNLANINVGALAVLLSQ